MVEVEEIYIQLPERRAPEMCDTQIGPAMKRRFVRLNEAAFVNEIKKRPILYQTNLRAYKRFSRRQEAWEQVAVAMNLSQQECRKRWRSLRDAFMKVIRLRNEEQRKSWVHYRLLEFLLPFIGKRGKRYRSEEFVPSFENSVDGMECINVDSDSDAYNNESITVSYVTVDGTEVFQVLGTPRRLAENAAVDVNRYEDLEAGQDPHYCVIQSDSESVAEEADTGQDMYLYEEPLESQLPPLIEKDDIDTSGLSFPSPMLGDLAKVSSIGDILPMDEDKSSRHGDHQLSSDVIESLTADLQDDSDPQIEDTKPSLHVCGHSPASPQNQSTPSSTSREEPDGKIVDDDSDERFLLSCLPNLRRLSNKKNQLARLRIQQMLFELEYEERYVYDGS